ncbi:General transcription factor IIH subunit 1 [Hypsibius exemplaris]|uniref:General transcription factor IIH subunit 1 n=1 Tax=Hypsibius exemplaris TaxID=2072580 RepID=A0A1W0WMH4_HYPEX|nr:General transcription factor IIH subunit 1 [Hypsibius exemplaris]
MTRPGNKANGHGEEIILVVEHVKHSNQKGSLYVTSENLAFQAAGKDSFDHRYHYSEIKLQKISPEGKSKVQLQIVLQSDDSSNFHFLNPKGQVDQLKDRNSVKDLLTTLLPKFKKKINKEMEVKNKALQGNLRLQQLYRDLVVSELVTADEFWAQNADKLTSQSASASQDTGISGAFLADVKPQADGCNSVRYNLTPEIIGSIFKTYPAVKKKHAETVPDTMTEQVFWTKFFQSHYFHKELAGDRNSDSIFSDCAVTEEKEMIDSARKGTNDPSANVKHLKDMVVDDEEGFGMSLYNADPSADANITKTQKRTLNMTQHQLIQRFNYHSSRILTATEGRSKVWLPNLTAESQPATPAESVASDVQVEPISQFPRTTSMDSELDSFQKDAGPSRLPLRLKKTDRYHQAPAKRKSTAVDQRHAKRRSDNLKAHVADLTTKRKVVISSQIAAQALHDVTSGKHRRQAGTDFQLPPPLKDEICGIYASLSEILRHYWSCYPPTDKFLQEKLTRMKKSIEKFEMERLRPLAMRVASEGQPVQLLRHIFEMTKAADNRYNTYMQQKRNG